MLVEGKEEVKPADAKLAGAGGGGEQQHAFIVHQWFCNPYDTVPKDKPVSITFSKLNSVRLSKSQHYM